MMRLEGRADKNNQLVGEALKSLESQKTVLEPLSALPTTFSISNVDVGFSTFVHYGNFWVPQAMPSGHTYQVVDFIVTPNNYQSSGVGSHFGVMTQVVSNSNFDTDFDAKGAAIFASANVFCSAGQVTVLQSWAIQNYVASSGNCGTYPGCSNPVFGLSPPSPSGYANTCGDWNAITPKRFLVGSNIWQQSRYIRCQPDGLCPEFTSADVDSTTPYFRLGGAGVAFVHVASAPVSWHLSFSNVSSYTAP